MKKNNKKAAEIAVETTENIQVVENPVETPITEIVAEPAEEAQTSLLAVVENSDITVNADTIIRVASSLNLCTAYVRKDNVTHVLFTGNRQETEEYLAAKVAETGAQTQWLAYPVIGKRRTTEQAVKDLDTVGFFKIRKDLVDKALSILNVPITALCIIPHGPFALVERAQASSLN